MAFQYRPKAERFPEPGIAESAAKNFVGSVGNVVGLLGEGAGHLMSSAYDSGVLPDTFGLNKKLWETTRDAGEWLSDWGQNFSQPVQLRQEWANKGFWDRVTNWDYWKDPLGATADISSGIGSSVPFMGVGIGGRALGAVLPTKQIANRLLFELGKNGGKFGQGINNFARTKLGKALGETADTGLNYSATVAPLDATTNMAEIIRPLKERGFTDSEISRLMLMGIAEELPVDIAENFITGNTILGKGFGLKGKTWKGRLGYGSLNIPLEATGEYVQEGYQTRGTQKYQGLPHTESPIKNLLENSELFSNPEERSAAASGGIAGAMFGAGGAIHHAISGKDQKETPPPNTDDVKPLRSWVDKHSGGVMKDDVFNELYRASQKYGVPFERVLATATAESNGDQYDVSPVGAIGVMQLMPNTARELGVDPYDMEQNIDGGVRYLKKMYDEFGDWDLAHAAYNAGPGAVKRFGGVPHGGGYEETRNYVDKINGYLSDAPGYQGGESSQAEEQGEIYVGENGAGEGKYWERNPSMGVSFDGAQPDLLNLVDMLAKKYYDDTGKRLVVNAGTNGNHADGEHSHKNGWKVDIVDAGGSDVAMNEDGPLFTADYGKGYYLDDFIAYGRSLGVGMNVEKLGTSSVHLDITLDGTQWDGNGEHAGGFNPQNARPTKRGGNVSGRPAGDTSEDEEVSDTEQSGSGIVSFDDVIKNILNDNSHAKFEATSNDAGTQDILSTFATEKRESATGEAALKLAEMFNSDGKFEPTRKNIKALSELFGDELQNFGQGKFNERWADLLKKSMTPDFVKDLTDDDKKLFGNILKRELKAAGVDLKGMGSNLAGLEKGDEKTFVNAWRAIQDRVKKAEESEQAEPLISPQTQQALDDIAQRIDELTTSSTQNAPQITEFSKLYKSINQLESDISKLYADRDKLSQATGNQAARVETASKIAKIDADIQKKQDELDAKIESFYNSPQPVKVEPSKRFAPIKAQAETAITNLNQQIETLKAQGVSEDSAEIEKLDDDRFAIQAMIEDLADLDSKAATAKKNQTNARNANNPQDYKKAKKQFESALNRYKKQEQALLDFLNPQPKEEKQEENFDPINDGVAKALTAISQQKAQLRSEGGRHQEITKLNKRRDKIQKDNNTIAKLYQQADALEEQIANEPNAQKREALQDALDALNADIDNKETQLYNYINPPQKEAPKTYAPRPEVAQEISRLNREILNTPDSGTSGNSVKKASDRINNLLKLNNEVGQAEEKMQEAASVLTATRTSGDEQAQIAAKTDFETAKENLAKKQKELEDFLNPPQKEAPKTYAPRPEVAQEISRLNREILNTPDSGTSDGSVKKANDRINNLLKLNNEVGQAEGKMQEAASVLTATRASGDEQAQIAAKTAFETAKENLEKKQKELEDLLYPPVKEEKKPEHYEPKGEAKAEIDRLNAEIETLRADDERKNSAEINDKAKRRDDIQKKVDNIGGLVASRGEKEKEREQAESEGRIQTVNRLTGEIAEKNTKIQAAEKELDNLLNPKNEDDELAETFEPVSPEVKAALEELQRRIDAEADPVKKEELKRQYRELENQNAKVAKLEQTGKKLEDQLSKKQVGSKGYQKVQKELDNNSKAVVNARKRLDKLVKALEPPKPKKKAPEHYEATGEAKDEIDKLNSEIESLRADDERKNSAEINDKAKRRDDIQGKVDNIGRLKASRGEKEKEREQAESEGRIQTVNRLNGEIAEKNTKIQAAEKELDNLLNPKNEDDELAETFDLIDDKVKTALEKLDQQIEQAEDGSAEKEKLERDRREIQKQNDIVAKLQTEKEQLKKDLSRKQTGSKGYNKVQNAIDNKSKTIASAKKKLAKLVAPFNQTEDTEIVIEDEKALAKIAELDDEIAELKDEDEKINEQEIAKKTKLRNSIFKTAREIAGLKAQKKVDTSKLATNEASLKKFLEPKTPKAAPAVAPKVKQAQKRLKEKSDKLWATTGKTDEEKKQIRADRADTEQSIRELEAQNNTVATLQDKVGRIKTALDEAVAKKDSASAQKYEDLFEKYNGKLETEMTKLIALAEQHLPVEKETKQDTEAETQSQEEPSEPLQVNANEYIQSALTPPVGGTDKAARRSRLEQAKKLRLLAKQHGIEIPEALKKALTEGTMKAITEVQKLLLDSGKLFNTEQQQTQPSQQKTNFDEDLKQAYQEISKDKAERKAQGNAILRVVDFSQAVNNPQFQKQFGNIKLPKIDLPDGLAERLQRGDEEAIIKAQEIFYNAGLKIESNTLQETSETESGAGLIGNTAEVITGSRESHQVRYKVVEAKDLTTSNEIVDNNVFANKEYPAELQPRDRERVDMQAQLISMGNNLNPADLLDSRNVNQGAPVTRSDGVVLNGNGRTAAIRYAYENGKGEAYKKALIQNAERLGLNANEISKMNQPVLIRELTHSLTDEELRDLTGTQTGGAQMGASEQAQADAKKLSQKTLGLFPPGDNVDITQAESEEFLRAAISEIATPEELNSLTTKGGQVNQDGINRVKRALFALAYNDNGIIARMSESVDSNIRGAINALLNAAPLIAKIQSAMKKGYLHKYDLSAIPEAVNKLSALRNEGKPVSNYLQEQSLFSEHADSEEMKEILSFIDANKHAPNKITAFLKKIAQRIQGQGGPREAGLFGKQEPTPLIDLIKLARQDIENNGMQDLFGQAETSSSKSAPSRNPQPTEQELESEQQEKDSSTNNRRIFNSREGKSESEEEIPSEKKELKQKEPEELNQEELDKDEELDRAVGEARESLTEEYQTDDGSIFGSIESARQRLFKVFGIKPPEAQSETSEQIDEQQTESSSANKKEDTRRPKLVDFVDDSEENEKRLIAEIQKELNKISANPMFNPKLWTKMLELGAVYVQRGINTLADWANKMTATLGKESEPWQNSIWETINAVPEGEKFDKEQTMAVAGYMGALREKNQAVSLAEMTTQLERDMGEELAKKLMPMIQASYKGIEKFFDDLSAKEKATALAKAAEQQEPEKPKKNKSKKTRNEQDLSAERQKSLFEDNGDLIDMQNKDEKEQADQPKQGSKADFEKGEFTNPETGEKQAGIKFNRKLPQQEYERIEWLASEYGGYWFTDAKAILFPNAEERDSFVDDFNGIYHGSEITKPISQARYIQQLQRILQSVYRLEIPNLERLQMPIRRCKEWIAGMIDLFAKAGTMKLVDGKIEYKDEKSYEGVKSFFANLVQQKSIDTADREPLPTIGDLKKSIRETLSSWSKDTEIVVSPQWDKNKEQTATEAKDFTIIPQRTLAEDVFKISYGEFGLAAYDTQEQALDAIRALDEAIKRGDKKFVFPMPEHLENKTEQTQSKATVEQENQQEELKQTTSDGITYPDGALTFGNESATKAYSHIPKKGGKAFDKNMARTVKINGREMTRLKVVENMAKGELDDSAMKLNKAEREYLDWLREKLIRPLEIIQQAGIQNEPSTARYSDDLLKRFAEVDDEMVYFDLKASETFIPNLTKLAETMGGTATKNSKGNTRFKFETHEEAVEFARVAEFFVENIHLPYFGNEAVVSNPLEELKDVELPEGVKISRVIMALNKQGVWRVSLAGTYPANDKSERHWNFNVKQSETNHLFVGLAQHFGGNLYADATFHFKDKDKALAFKNALDEHLGLYETPKKRKEPKQEAGTPAEVEEPGILTANFNPFRNVHLPQNPSDKFTRAYEAIKAAWSSYEAGELDIRETGSKVRDIVEGAMLTREEHGNRDRMNEIDILRGIRDSIVYAPFSPEDQKANEDAWLAFFVLKRAFDYMHNTGKISDSEYHERHKKINELEHSAHNLSGDVLYEGITKVKAFAKLKEILPEVKAAEIKAYLTAAQENPRKEKVLWGLMTGEKNGADVFYSDDILNMKSIDAGIESGEMDKLLERAQFDKRGNFLGFKPEEEPQTESSHKENQPQSDAERAKKEIDVLIEEWKPRDYKEATIYNHTDMAKKLSEMVLAGVISPDEAVDTANKLLNGTGEEWEQAHDTYYDAYRKLQDKRAREFNPEEGIARLNKIAEEFPVLKRDVEFEIKEINKGNGGELVNDDISLTGKTDDKVEQWATYKLIDKWTQPYDEQTTSQVLGRLSENYTGATKIYHEASEMLRRAKEGEIPTQGIYKQVEEFLNSPHEGLMTDDEWRKNNAINSRVEYLFFKNHGNVSLERIQDNFKNTFGKKFADSIASQIESAYNEFANDSQARFDAQNPKIRNVIVANDRGKITERAISKAFNIDTKNFKTIDTMRSEIYDKIKADEHPNLKTYVDKLLEKVYNPYTPKSEKENAQQQIDVTRASKFSDERLNELEKKAMALNNNEQEQSTETEEVASSVEESQSDVEKAKVETTEVTEKNKHSASEESEMTAQETNDENNPFNEKIPDNAITQSAEFKQTLNEMKKVWADYQKGNLDIREAEDKIGKLVEDYTKTVDHYSNDYAELSFYLSKIQRAMEGVRLSPEEQAKDKSGWNKLQALGENIRELHNARKISDKEYNKLDKEFQSLVKKINHAKITGETAYQRLKEKLPASILEEATANVEESGESAGLDGGHRDVESAVRAGTDETVRQEGRSEVSDENSGQERQARKSVGERDTESNAESERPVQADDAGSTSARTGTRNGVRGDSETVQPATGDERGRSDVSGNVENVEQRANDILRQSGNEENGAFDSQSFSVETEPVVGTSTYTKVRVTVKLPKEASGITTYDSHAYDDMAKAINAVKDEYKDASYICDAEDAPALKRAFEIYLSQGIDERIKQAFERLKAENNFSEEQLKWIDRIESYMRVRKAYGRLEAEDFDREGTSFARDGGFERIDKIIDGKLADILTEINSYVYDKKQSDKQNKPVEYSGHNFHITEDSGIGEGGLKEKFKQNIAAIKLLKQLESEGRKATPSEQAILAKFNGWGTLASAFSNDPKWAKENQQLRELLTPEEYDAAHGAITNAFYTSPQIASAIWQGLGRLGFKGGRILDPSTGSGIFFGTMPLEMQSRSELVGTELDSLTGRIAQQLYQQADIAVTGFENRALPDNYFDLAISNVPFGSEVYRHNGENYKLHDYFFAKAMDKVRPGGLVAFITSTGSMGGKLRSELQNKADLIAAFKLPSNTFDKNAGTQVTSDILIFQKRADPSKPSEHAQAWQKTEQLIADGEKLNVNEYFVEHPDHMIGKPKEDKLYPGRGRLALDGKGRDVVKELGELMSKLPEDVFQPLQRAASSKSDGTLQKLAATAQEGSFVTQDGKLYQKQGNQFIELTGKEVQTVKAYQGLQKALDAFMSAQLNPSTTEEKLSALQQKLNDTYDAFVKDNGYVNSLKNVKLLSGDPAFGRVAAIEDYHLDKKTKKESASKTDIFFKRVAGKSNEPTSAGTALDGLNISLNLRGHVDMKYISDLTGESVSELEHELGDLIYLNPATNEHELAEAYLSGNVRDKLAQAQKAARHNPTFKRNVEALKKVQPQDLTEHDIQPHLGATWIPSEYYVDFVRYILGEDFNNAKIHYSVAGVWNVEGETKYGSNYFKWLISRPKASINFFALLECAMNNQSIVVNDSDTKKANPVKTAEANKKLDELRDAFEKWIWQDEYRKKDLLEKYNVMFNSEVLRTYDGSHLTFPKTEGFPELSSFVKDKLYKHQKDAIWRIIQGKNTLLAHCVGAGKTWTMQIAAMEMKRMGLIRKPMFIVPNNITGQFALDFKKAFPDAKILMLTSTELKDVELNFTYDEKLNLSGRMDPPKSAIKAETDETAEQRKERLATRRKTLEKIRTGDWDGVIISHDLFQRLPVSPEAEKAFIQEQIALLEREKRSRIGNQKGTKGFEKKTARLDKSSQSEIKNGS